MEPLDAPALAYVRPDARWPWWALAAGAALIAVGAFAFSPDPAPVTQPASLVVADAP